MGRCGDSDYGDSDSDFLIKKWWTATIYKEELIHNFFLRQGSVKYRANSDM